MIGSYRSSKMQISQQVYRIAIGAEQLVSRLRMNGHKPARMIVNGEIH